MELSIIIIEYHCADQVVDCVNSINQYLSDVDNEILVISNSEYTEQQLVELGTTLPETKIIDANGNLGYAGGVNTGLKSAIGEFVYILNPDCLLTDSNVTIIMKEMREQEDWAIAGPKVVDEDNVVQPSCRAFPKPWTFFLVRSVLSVLPGAAKERRRYLIEDFDRNHTREVDWVSGGATLVKASTIAQIGGMDERYFLYMEDVDWCRSCWRAGYKVKYNPVSTVIHAGQHQSIKGSFLDKLKSKHVRMHFRSLFKYFLKYGFKLENY